MYTCEAQVQYMYKSDIELDRSRYTYCVAEMPVSDESRLMSQRYSHTTCLTRGRTLGRNWDKRVSLIAIHIHRYYGFYPPPPYTDTSSLRTLKTMPRNLNETVRSWIRLQSDTIKEYLEHRSQSRYFPRPNSCHSMDCAAFLRWCSNVADLRSVGNLWKM